MPEEIRKKIKNKKKKIQEEMIETNNKKLFSLVPNMKPKFTDIVMNVIRNAKSKKTDANHKKKRIGEKN